MSLSIVGHKRLAAFVIAAGLLPTSLWAQDPSTERFPRLRLLNGLQSSNAVVRAAAIESLKEHGQTPEVADVLITVLDRQYDRRSRLRSTTYDMVRLLGTIDTDEVADAMLKYLAAFDHKIVIAAADHLSRRVDPRALEPLLSMHEREDYAKVFGLRKCVTDAITRYSDRRAIEYALTQLPTARGTIRYSLYRYLMHVARQEFGADAAIWNLWWSDNGDDFQFPEEAYSPVGATDAVQIKGLDAPRYYNLPIHAQRLVFVIDRSGSMSAGGDLSRLQTAKIETKTAVNSLSEEVYFSVVAFDARVRLWNRDLVAATEDAQQQARQYIDELETGQGTSSLNALMDALQLDDNTEALFFLSDGRPSSGDLTEPDDIIAAIDDENYFRRASIYSIGVGVADETEEFMKNLAARTSGVYHGVGGEAGPEEQDAPADEEGALPMDETP